MPNVYFLYGNDEFAITHRLKAFEADFSDPSNANMNIARLEARTMSPDELNNAVNTIPFLVPERLVLLANPSGKYTSPKERKGFQAFIGGVPNTARLVIHEIIEPRDVNTHWLVKWSRNNGETIKLQAFMLPRQWEMAGWIINEAKNHDGEIEPPAAAKLADMVGVNTRQANQEITKLLAYVNWERKIKVQDVEAVSIVTAQESVFDFVDALASGDGHSAQRRLYRLLEREEPFSLWGMVIRQFRLLLLAREVLDAGGDKDEVTKALRVHSFVGEKTTGQARRFNLQALEKIYRRLLEFDEGVKTGQFTLELALDILVVDLTKEIIE